MFAALLALLACHAAPDVSSCDACDRCVVEHLSSSSRDHVSGGIDYPDPPPAGGDHDPCWTTWGVHTEEVPDENWVHNLEHGGVVFLTNCPDGCPEDWDTLAGIVDAHPGQAVLTPYSLMDDRFAVVAWEYRMLTDCVDPAAFDAFFQDHVDQAPESETAAPGASCM